MNRAPWSVLSLLLSLAACAAEPSEAVPDEPPPASLGAVDRQEEAGESPVAEAFGSSSNQTVEAPEAAREPSIETPNDPAATGCGNAVGAELVPQRAGCPCTRRPDRTPNYRCPWGSGKSVSSTIGSEGGNVQVGDTAATAGVPTRVKIPRGALLDLTPIRLTELTCPPPSGYLDYSPVYRLDPVDLSLHGPAEISITGTNVDGTIPRSIAVYFAESVEGPYTRMPDSYANAGFYQATLQRGGYYFVGASVSDGPIECR